MILLVSALLLTAEPSPAAVRLTRKATVEYNAGEFGQAFLDYQAAYDLEPLPELLFDLAQTQRGLHHWERAAFLYRRYLSAKPQARNRAKVEELLAQVEQKQGEPTPAAAPPDVPAGGPAAPLPPPPPDVPLAAAGEPGPTPSLAKPVASTASGLPLGTRILGGAGGGALLGAGALGLAVLLQPDAVTLQSGTPSHSLTYAHLAAINTEGTFGVGLAVAGAVLIGAAALWWLASP